MKSIMQRDPNRCYLCGEESNWVDGKLELHHVFHGTANRKKSTEWGLTVRLHAFKCHRTGGNSVHKNREMDLKLMKDGQEAFEAVHGDRDLFRHEFGKSIL